MSSTRRSSRNAARQAAREREDVAVQEVERQLFGAPIGAPPDNNPNNFGAVLGGLADAAPAAPPEDPPVQEMDQGAPAEAPIYIDPALANSYDEEDPAEEGLDAETRHTLRAHISPSTRSNYENSSVRLVRHLYGNKSKYPHILKERFINDLDQAVTEEENHVTARGCPSRARTSFRMQFSLLFVPSSQKNLIPIPLPYPSSTLKPFLFGSRPSKRRSSAAVQMHTTASL
jgi:hypothetical protein